MIIKTNYETLQTAITPLKAVLADKLTSDAIKNIIFITKADGSVTVAAYNTTVSCFSPLTGATVDWGEGVTPADTWFQMKSDLVKKLDGFKSVKRTVADEIEIDFKESHAVLKVSEHAAEGIPEDKKSRYSAQSKTRIASPKLNSGIQRVMEGFSITVSGEQLNAIDVKTYMDALSSTLPVDAKDNMSTRIMAVGSDIYTAPSLYFAIMENRLPSDKFTGFVLTQSAASFIRSYLDCVDMFSFDKTENENSVVLKFSSEKCIAYVTAQLTKNVLDCTKYKVHSNTGIVLDKDWFIDQLNRVGSSDAFSFATRIYSDHAVCRIESKEYNMPEFPALLARLDKSEFANKNILKQDETGADYVDIKFSIRADLFSKLLFSGTIFKQPVYLYFEVDDAIPDAPSISMAVLDDTQIWQTKINRLTASRSDFKWEED